MGSPADRVERLRAVRGATLADTASIGAEVLPALRALPDPVSSPAAPGSG